MSTSTEQTRWSDPQSDSRSLEGELLDLIGAQVRRAWVPHVVVCILMALLVSIHIHVVLPLIWFVVVTGGGWAHTQLLMRTSSDASLSDRQKLEFFARSFTLQGLLRGSLVVMFPLLPVITCAVASIYIASMCAAVLYATTGRRQIYLPFCAAMVTPLSLVWLLDDHLPASLFERVSVVALFLAFTAGMLGHAGGTYRNFESAYRMRRERLDLNRKLTEALTQAESASRAKTRFLASASHDLRQPIHALSLFSGSLSLRPLDTPTAAIAKQIDKAIRVLGSQLDALLDISRLDAGVVEVRLAVIDLEAMLDELVQTFGPQAEKRGLSLSVRCCSRVLLHSDAGLLLRILSNVLSNAIKHTQSGSVRIEVEHLPDKCRIAVIDTGPGIPVHEQQRVFEEFYQLDNPERDRTQGLGLGLSIVRRLTDLLGINLHLHSIVGHGTRLELLVPTTTEPTAESSEALMNNLPPVPNVRVLVVDDEEMVQLGMKTLLEEMGFEVALVASTESAVALADSFKPSIVLADLRLHGHDNGLQTIEALRARNPNLPALLISGDTAPDRLQMAHAAGIKLLHKPLNATQLHTEILTAVEI